MLEALVGHRGSMQVQFRQLLVPGQGFKRRVGDLGSPNSERAKPFDFRQLGHTGVGNFGIPQVNPGQAFHGGEFYGALVGDFGAEEQEFQVRQRDNMFDAGVGNGRIV